MEHKYIEPLQLPGLEKDKGGVGKMRTPPPPPTL